MQAILSCWRIFIKSGHAAYTEFYQKQAEYLEGGGGRADSNIVVVVFLWLLGSPQKKKKTAHATTDNI